MYYLSTVFRPKVLWADEQHWKQRQKRDLIDIDPSDVPKVRVKRVNEQIAINKNTSNASAQKFRRKRYAISNEVDQTFNDELWSQQWYLVRFNKFFQ